MAEFHARIGRVRMKNGGADVHILHRDNERPDGESWPGRVIENAKAVASYDEPGSELVGYLLVGIYSDGCTSFGFRYDTNRCPIPRSLLPSWIAELVRRDMITAKDTEDKFNEMFEWRE